MRAYARPTAAILALAGVAVLAWVAITLTWGEPFTAVEAAHAQAGLRQQLEQTEATVLAKDSLAKDNQGTGTIARRARAFRQGLGRGAALGRIVVPRLHLRTVLVEGTRKSDLARGPGHYRITALPGLGGVVAVAGHRTTYLQPFRHIDRLQPGDSIILELPYGTFRYVVYAHRIVDDRDWSILRRRPFEKLVLSACHPLHSASQRIVVFARLRTASARTSA
jgi:sortase A